MGQRYFQNTMVIGPELDGDDVDSVILKAAAAALKVGGYFAWVLPPAISLDCSILNQLEARP